MRMTAIDLKAVVHWLKPGHATLRQFQRGGW